MERNALVDLSVILEDLLNNHYIHLTKTTKVLFLKPATCIVFATVICIACLSIYQAKAQCSVQAVCVCFLHYFIFLIVNKQM